MQTPHTEYLQSDAEILANSLHKMRSAFAAFASIAAPDFLRSDFLAMGDLPGSNNYCI